MASANRLKSMLQSPGAIDIWANYWPEGLFSAFPDLAELYRRLELVDRTHLEIDDLLAEAEKSDIRRVLISSAEFPGSPITNNRLAFEVQRRPDVLLGCGSVDPLAAKPHHEVMRCVEELGFRAIKVVPFFCNLAPNNPLFYPVYAACQDLGVPILILTGHMAVKVPSSFGNPQYIDEIALAFPSLSIVAGHAGWPWTDELLSLAWKHENVYIDTSGHRPKHWSPSLVKFASTYGSTKVVFGSGYPMLSYETLLNDMTALNLPQASQQQIMSDNAASLLGLGVDL